MSDKFILVEGKPVLEPDLIKWAKWFETGNRVVEQTQLEENIQVSTVFLGFDHSFGYGHDPVLWETIVFGGTLDGEMDRYTSLEEAKRGHNKWVIRAKKALLTEEGELDD